MKGLILRLIIGGLILIIINPTTICLAHSSLLNNSTLPYIMQPGNIKPLVHDVLEQGVKFHFNRLQQFRVMLICGNKHNVVEMGTVSFKNYPYIWGAISNFNIQKQSWQTPSIFAESINIKRPVYMKVILQSKTTFIVGWVTGKKINSGIISINDIKLHGKVTDNHFCFEVPLENPQLIRLIIINYKIEKNTIVIEAKKIGPVKKPNRVYFSQIEMSEKLISESQLV